MDVAYIFVSLRPHHIIMQTIGYEDDFVLFNAFATNERHFKAKNDVGIGLGMTASSCSFFSFRDIPSYISLHLIEMIFPLV